MSENSKASCGGCLGSILVLTVIGSIFSSHAGLFLRVGSVFFTLGRPTIDGKPVGSLVETETIEANKTLAEAIVKKFHEQLDQGKCNEIYDQSSDFLKKFQSKESILPLCETWKNTGGLKSSELVDWWGKPTENQERMMLMRYLTITQSSPVQETFIWSIKENKAELVSYQANSNAVPSPSPKSSP